MAYANKYKITVATKNNTISYLYLLEDGYSGSVIEYPGVNLSLSYIPRSDDVFEAIIASQLNITLDVTDNYELMPNFITLNDRKYLVELYSGSDLQWQGFAISDSVNVSFTTGRRYLDFNAIDGLGMLETINYVLPSTYALTSTDKTLNFILNSLNLLGYPTGLNIISGISYFAYGMTNRTTSTSADPLNQSYIRYTTFTNDNGIPTNCLEVLTTILKGFGARLFQAGAKWYIITPNQFAQDSYYFTEYNSSGTIITSGTKSYSGTITGYTGNTSGLYFLDNNQNKLLRKGYNKISYNKSIDYPNNYITNANLQSYTGNDAFGWTEESSGGLVHVKVYEKTENNSFILSQPASVSPDNLPYINLNDILKLSFDFSNIISNSDKSYLLKLLITITNGSVIYYLNSNNSWVGTSSNYNIDYDGAPFPAQATGQNKNVSISAPATPQSGTLSIKFFNDSDCIDWVEISNFKLDCTQLYKSVTIESYVNNSDEYVYTPDINLGINYTTTGQFYYRGVLSDSSGNILYNWYRQEYPADIYNSLVQLVIKQYSNILQHNVINIDSTIYNNESVSGKLNPSMRVLATDTDTVNSVDGKKYLLSNSTIDIVNAEVQSTLLEVTSDNITTTMTISYEDTNPARVWGRKRSLGQTTSSGASSAPLTDNVIYQSGATFYTDRNLSLKFNGANLYYKVLNDNTYTTNIYHIDPNGKIIAFSPR